MAEPPPEKRLRPNNEVASDAVAVSVVTLAGTTVGEWRLQQSTRVIDVKELVVAASGGGRGHVLNLLAGGRALQDADSLGDTLSPGTRQLRLSLVRSGLGHAVSCGEDRVARLWDLERGECLRELRGHTSKVCFASSDWGKQRLLTCGYDQALCLWDLRTGELLREAKDVARVGSKDGVCVDWVEGRVLLGTMEGSLQLWDLEHGQGRQLRGHRSCVDMVLAGAGRALTASRDKTLRLWDLEKGKCLRVLTGHSGSVQCGAVDWASEQVLSASFDRTLRLWHGNEVQVLRGHNNFVLCLTVDWPSRRALSGGRDGLRLWDLEAARALKEMKAGIVECVSMDWTLRRAVTGGAAVRLWDLRRGDLLTEFVGQAGGLLAGWSVGRLLGCGDDGVVRLWDLDKPGEALLELKGHVGAVLSVVAQRVF